MKTALRILKTLPAWFYPLALLLIGMAGTALGAGTDAPTYTPLVGIPGVTDLKNASIAEYINALYLLSISIGGLIGVVKISMAGVKYSMSDIVTSKEEAKEDIKGVLLGLGILLIPFIVLNTIYAGLTNLDVLKLKDADKIKLEPSKANTGGGGGTPTGGGFIESLPRNIFDNRGVCTSSLIDDPSAVGSGGKRCSPNCREECTSRGGTATQYGGQAGNSCPPIMCMK